MYILEGLEMKENSAHYLTLKRLNVLKLMAKGLRNKEIAYQLGLSESTVKQHVSAMMRQLNADTRTAVVVTAQKLGLIDKE